MAKSKSKSKHTGDKYVFMENTRSLLSDMWDHWTENLGHTPAVAKKKMASAIKEFHKVETKGKKLKSKVKKTVKKKVASARKKVKHATK